MTSCKPPSSTLTSRRCSLSLPSSYAIVTPKAGTDKQDCEINAGYRMLERLRTDSPRMAAIIVADSLYSKQPFVERLRAARFSFLLVAKPGDHSSLYQDVDGLRRGNLLNRHAYRPPRRTARVRVGH